jgi:hypothetical protein
MKRLTFIIIFFGIITTGFAQNADTLTFAKGRMMTSLYGSLANQQVNIASGGSLKTTGYIIGTKSGSFIKNNWVLGLNFALSRTDFSNNDLDIDYEDLLLGLWTRLYFAQKGGAALYAELTPYYAGIHRQTILRDNNGVVVSNKEVSGSGIGLMPGFGFTYIINRNVGFGMTVAVPLARLKVDTEDLLLKNTVSDTFNAVELQFNFNFQVYLDQFFF